MTFSRTSPDHAHLIGMRSDGPRTGGPAAICLVIHGGRSVSRAEVFATQVAVLRMRPIARALARARPALAVHRLQLAVRGWNGTGFAPVRDARWAVRTLAGQYPGVPIVLVGHSMGARTALRVADEPAVTAVVGLAPWLPPDEPVQHLVDVPVRLLHGDRDRIIPEPSTHRLIARMLAAGVDVEHRVLPGTGHAMLRRWRRWNDETVAAVTGLLDDPDAAPRPRPAGDTGSGDPGFGGRVGSDVDG